MKRLPAGLCISNSTHQSQAELPGSLGGEQCVLLMSGQPDAQCSRRHGETWSSRRSTGCLQIVLVLACCALAASGQGNDALKGNSDTDGDAFLVFILCLLLAAECRLDSP